VTSRRSLPVPEGLDGLRLDAAISRLFGLSRTGAADLVDEGGQVGQPGSGAAGGVAVAPGVVVGAEHAEHAVQLGQRLAAGGRDRGDGVAGPLGVGA